MRSSINPEANTRILTKALAALIRAVGLASVIEMSGFPTVAPGPRVPELEAELTELYHRHSAELLRYAETLTRTSDEARDSVQEVFLRYFIERRYGREIESSRGWLFQALRYHCLDRLKSVAGQREVSKDDLDRVPDRRHDPEALLQRRELATEIASKLSERELDCLRLRALGLRYTEVAQAMGVRSGTVGALLARVNQKLRPSREKWMAPDMAEAVCSFLLEGQTDSP